jgi:hypothetical protein
VLELLNIISNAVLIALAVIIILAWAAALFAVHQDASKPLLTDWLKQRENEKYAKKVFNEIEEARNDFA